MSLTRVSAVLTISLALAACGPPAAGPATPGSTLAAADTLALHPDAVAQIEALIAEKQARSPVRQKIASQLLYLKDGMPSGRAPSTRLEGLAKPDAAGRYLVDLQGDLTPALLGEIAAQGGVLVSASAEQKSARAYLTLGSLEALASDPGVQALRPALQALTRRADPPRTAPGARTLTREERVAAMQLAVRQALLAPRAALEQGAAPNAGSVTSEGSAAHGAERARKYFGVNGAGVKVGVLSDSDDFREQSIATGDLPANTVTVPGQSGRPGTGEGTAMLQIVHDVAPGAQLFFATAFGGPHSFADNIRTLRFTYGCDIIIDDVIYYFESPYSDDVIAAAVDDVTAAGALYFSSAGNEGHATDGTSGTWEGDFKSAGVLATLPSGYTVHDFGGGVISNRIEGWGGPLSLNWSDPGTLDAPASSNDYDVFILDHDLRTVLVASTDTQAGAGLPWEFIPYYLPPGLRVVVAAKPGAQPRALRVTLFGGELALSTPGAIFGHAAARDAFAVAAVDAAEAAGGEFSGGPTTPVELFSSDGNRAVFWDRNGKRLGTGGLTFASEGGERRRKPDLAAADGVRTTLPSYLGLNPFYGTSAAAPHAGAVAALLRAAVPRATPAQVRRALTSGALDIQAAGVDRDSGGGLVAAFSSLQALGAQPAVLLELGAVAVASTSGDFLAPGGSAGLTVQLTNAGGATAGSTRATLSSRTAGVTITQATASYGNLGSGASGSNATPLAFQVAPSVPCGTQVALRLSVSFTGRGTNPTVFDLVVPTGRVGSTELSTAYAGAPVAIPDGDLAGANIPLTVTGGGPIARLAFTFRGTACSTWWGSTEVGLDHPDVGELSAVLTSPAGTSVQLLRHPGYVYGFGSNFCQTRLDDWGSYPIQQAWPWLAPYSGTFVPESSLAAFNGQPASGTWVLNVSDDVYGYTGNVRAFSIETTPFECSPAPPPSDAGTPPPPSDAGTPPPPPSDAGTPPPPSDAGTPPPPSDAGTPPPSPDGG
jgi:subtilisin-like proprotein convertase family protein